MDDLIRQNDVYNIPSIEPQSMMHGCDDCKYETYPDFYYPCCDCKNNYVDKWQMKEGEK